MGATPPHSRASPGQKVVGDSLFAHRIPRISHPLPVGHAGPTRSPGTERQEAAETTCPPRTTSANALRGQRSCLLSAASPSSPTRCCGSRSRSAANRAAPRPPATSSDAPPAPAQAVCASLFQLLQDRRRLAIMSRWTRQQPATSRRSSLGAPGSGSSAESSWGSPGRAPTRLENQRRPGRDGARDSDRVAGERPPPCRPNRLRRETRPRGTTNRRRCIRRQRGAAGRRVASGHQLSVSQSGGCALICRPILAVITAAAVRSLPSGIWGAAGFCLGRGESVRRCCSACVPDAAVTTW